MARVWDRNKYAACAAAAAAEGIVLLKNRDDALPLHDGERIALFGRSQFNYYRCGTGSGGSVNVDYVIGIREALKNCGRYQLDEKVSSVYESWVAEHPFEAGHGWATEPWSQEEMPLKEDLVREAAAGCDAALVLIGRTAGEDRDNRDEEGSYRLSTAELDMITKVCRHFKRSIVLLNTGNIIDMKWVEETDPAAVAYVWQGGQEGGNGVLRILSGGESPSGKLPDTIAYDLSDYPSTPNFGGRVKNEHQEDIYVGYRYFETFAPDKVLYPFGYGLSYTSFMTRFLSFEMKEDADGHTSVRIKVSVINTGERPGKEVVQVYVSAPQGRLGKPARVLCDFAKTGSLFPGQAQEILFEIPDYRYASYDDSGLSGYPNSYVLEEGLYSFLVGTDVKNAAAAGSRMIEKTILIRQCSGAMAPVSAFKRIRPAGADNDKIEWEDVPLQTVDPALKRLSSLPENRSFEGDKGYKLKDAASGRVPMEDFLSQITDEGLCAMIRGEGMSSPKVTPGIAGAFGGVTDELLGLGIPVAGCADGPSGIRMDCGMHAFSLPNGTCLASTFNEKLCRQLYEWEGLELRRNRIDALLGPGMNIHRHPLNGRNFEYFSEDPLLTGRIAASQLRGMASCGISGVIKHFAANTQETNRHRVDNIISQRALREIYLKGFEIAVREGNARAVMSTYGPVNGIWTSGHYDLLTVILRKEWGFDGIVMTDWWAAANDGAGMKGTLANAAAQVRAQNDLNMVNANAGANSNGDNLQDSLRRGTLTRGELLRSAANICRFLLATPAWLRSIGEESELDKALAATLDEGETTLQNAVPVKTGARTELDITGIVPLKGRSSAFTVTQERRGRYDLVLEVRTVSDNPRAQIPLTIFKDAMVAGTVTLTGADSKWRCVTVPLEPSYMTNFMIRFYFGQTGMEIRSARLIMREDLEERFLEMSRAKRE